MTDNIAELVDLIGQEEALKLARSCPVISGRRVLYVPVRIKNAARYAKVISEGSVKKLHASMAGCQISLGDPDNWERKQRALKMLTDPTIPIGRIAVETKTPRSFLYRHWC